MKPTPGIKPHLTRLAKIKDITSAKYQREIDSFKTTLRKNSRLHWVPRLVSVDKDHAKVYQALGEILEEGVIQEFIFDDFDRYDGLTSLSTFIKKSKLKTLILKHLNENTKGLSEFAKNLPLTLNKITLNSLHPSQQILFFKNLPPLKLETIKIISIHYSLGELTPNCARDLAKVIEDTSPKELILSRGVLNLTALEILQPSLEKSSLLTLDISHGFFKEDVPPANELENDLKRCEIISNILIKAKISTCDLSLFIKTEEGFQLIFKNLPKTFLKVLRVNNNMDPKLINNSIGTLADALPHCLLEYLSLGSNQLTVSSAQKLAEKIPNSLIINIPPEGIKERANAILQPVVLQNKNRRIMTNALMKTTLDPILPRAITDLIESYVTDNQELHTHQNMQALQQLVFGLTKDEPTIKYQALQETSANSLGVKRRKLG